MLTITMKVNAPAGKAIGIKEDLAMYCEKFGDVKVVSIEDDSDERKGTQMGLFGTQKGKKV